MSDEQSEINLARLYPPFAAKLRQLISALGGNWIVDEGFRSFDEQAAYYQQGRSRPGALITRDRAGYSGHNYGTAAHLVPTVEGAIVRDNAAFFQLATEAANLGLQWGGSDASGKFIEMSRVEMAILSVDECLVLFKRGALPVVWAAFDTELGIQPAPAPPVFEINPEGGTLLQGNVVELNRDAEIVASEGTLAVPDDVRAELAAEVEAEKASEGPTEKVEPEAPARKKSPVVERREKAKAKSKK